MEEGSSYSGPYASTMSSSNSSYDCPYAQWGCTTKINKQIEAQHLDSNREYHIQLMSAHMSKMAARMAKLEEENKVLRALVEPEKLEQFRFRNVSKMLEAIPPGKQIVSENFIAFNREWQLRFYPNGISAAEPNNNNNNSSSSSSSVPKHFGLYIDLVDGAKRPRTMTYTLTIVHHVDPNKSAVCGPFTKLFGENGNSSWGSAKLLSHEKFKSDPGFVGENDSLHIVVRLQNPLLC